MNRYFDPNRENHILLLKFLTASLPKKEEIVMVGYGNRTQHLFKNGKYLMTINWNLV